MDFHFYTRSVDELNKALTTYVSDTASNVIAAVSGVTYTLLSIYVVLWGIAVLRGLVGEPITDGVIRVVRLAIIVGIAMNLGRYTGLVSEMFWSTPEKLASAVVGNGQVSNSVIYLDSVMSRVYDLGDAYWQSANANGAMVPDLGLMALALSAWLAGLAATAYGAFLLVLSKIALALLLGIGPLFILLLIFEASKRFFEAWLGQVLNYLFLVLLTAGAIKLVLSILESYLIDAAGAGVLANPAANQAFPALALCGIADLVLIQLPSIASALGGGVAISTLNAVGWSYSKAGDAVASVRPTQLRRSMHRAQSDVRIVAGVANAAASTPMALYRKVTGQTKNRVSRG